MKNKTIEDQLNDQVNREFYSAYLYLDMSLWMEERGMKGFSHWFHKQAHEEMDHAQRIIRHMQDCDMKVLLQAIDMPDRNYETEPDLLFDALNHEEYVTASINVIYGEAEALQDYRTLRFLDWFITEQTEEEAQVRDLIVQWKAFAGTSGGRLLLDQKMAQR